MATIVTFLQLCLLLSQALRWAALWRVLSCPSLLRPSRCPFQRGKEVIVFITASQDEDRNMDPLSGSSDLFASHPRCPGVRPSPHGPSSVPAAYTSPCSNQTLAAVALGAGNTHSQACPPRIRLTNHSVTQQVLCSLLGPRLPVWG